VSVSTGYPIYKLLLIAYNVLTCSYMAWATLEILHRLYPEKKLIGKKAVSGISKSTRRNAGNADRSRQHGADAPAG